MIDHTDNPRERVEAAPSRAVVFLVVGLAYLAVSQYVMLLNDPVNLGAGFWPAAGLTLGALLLLPERRWAWVIGAIAAAESGGSLAHGYPLSASVWWTAGNCLEPLVGATLIRHFGNQRGRLVPLPNLLIFLVGAVVIAPLIGASVGSVGSIVSIGNPFWQVWPKYVIGDALGVLVVAPAVLSWREPRTGRSLLETALLVVCLSAICLLAFRNWPSAYDAILPYLVVPFLTWAALRFGIRGAAWAVLLAANVANAATAMGYGPFAIEGGPVGHAITLLQIFLVITAATALILAALVDDLTDRRHAEAALRQQAELLDKARDAIVVFDMDGRVRFWNRGAERIYGWRRDEALGRPVEELRDVEAADYRTAVKTLLREDEWTGPLQQRNKDGTMLSVEGHWTLMRDDDGRPQSVLAISTDISQRLAVEDQLRQSQRLEAVGQLTGGVAHDFNNLLMVIVGNAELLAEALDNNPRLSPLADMIGRAAQRGSDLVRQMLAFARRQSLDPEVVDVVRRIDAMKPLLRSAVAEDIEIQYVHEPQSWHALIDPVQLESALLNLVINARDAMPDGGRLRIETSNLELSDSDTDYVAEVNPGHYLQIAVTDTGTGIAAQHIDRVFDPFYTTKSTGAGSGLGLSMVYGFVKQSGGHITLDSTPGSGTTVRLYLPAAAQEATTTAPHIDDSTAAPGSGKVLLVEDDELVREHVRSLLASLGYQVVQARNGDEGMEMLRGHDDIDLLFTDVVMPGRLNGLELAEAAWRVKPGLAVLFTSGYAEDVLADRAGFTQSVELLLKPYRRQELAAALRRVLQST